MSELVKDNLDEFLVKGISFDPTDYQIVLETQAGIPIVTNPFHELAQKVGISEDDFVLRLQKLKDAGFIRKMAGTPNHYKIGYTANAMTVWNIPDEVVDHVGAIFKSAGFISHCYIRPRALPVWPYNLFAMVHGRSRDEVSEQVEHLKELIAGKYEEVELIYSSKILKKTGIRIKRNENV
jgi:DNA-binding Lrp family transcriptional regulator